MHRLVVLRHGQSEWNRDDRFAGWMDVPLTPAGIEQARRAGAFMKERGFVFDRCYTSVLCRATRTAQDCFEAMGRRETPIERHWRLNERHYGALHSLNKTEVTREFGEEQLRLWRRSYEIRPPPAPPELTEEFRQNPLYAGVDVPGSESPADTVSRILPFWKNVLRPALMTGTRALVVAHGTSLRALVKVVCGASVCEVESLEFSNGIPFAIEFSASGQALLPVGLYS